MLPREVVRQIRRLQIRARRAVEDLLGGAYRSVFKGTGLAFEEVREYQPGDDIRSIDWNVTARMGHPFVKRFVEERELTVVLAVDCSASLDFGTRAQSKRQVATELAAILAFSALANSDKVGLVLFTDRVERYVPPRKSTRHVLRILRDLLVYQPVHAGTSLRAPLDFLGRVLHRRAVVFLLSDFLNTGFERSFKRTGRRHDLITFPISDPREQEMPPVGLVTFEDAETGRQLVVDTADPRVRLQFQAAAEQRRAARARLARSALADQEDVSTMGNHLDSLIRFFQRRARRLRRV